MTALQQHLEDLGACAESRLWAGHRTPEAAWECERPEWLLWWASRTRINPFESVVRAAAACIRSVLSYIPDGETRPLRAIEAAELWATDPSEENKRISLAASEELRRAAESLQRGADCQTFSEAVRTLNTRWLYNATACVAQLSRAGAAMAIASLAALPNIAHLCPVIRNILACPYEDR